jgi:SAM-dependent methyltransferase
MRDKIKLFIKYVPFSYMWYIRKFSDHPKTVLDIGCGNGELMSIITDKFWKITGLDIFKESLDKANETGCYSQLIQGDLIKSCRKLVKSKKKYDLVFCSQVIEHISKEDGNMLLDLADKLAKKRIYFGTPRGYMEQPQEFLGNNPYQKHLSGWNLDDFIKRGYKVYGVGFNPVWKEQGLARGKSKLEILFLTIITFPLNPLVYYIPSLGAGIMAIKEL